MRVLTYPELKSKKGIDWTRKTVSRKGQDGKFPRAINIGDNSVVWDEDEIDAWLEARKRERDAPKRLAAREGYRQRAREAWRRRKAEAAELERMAANQPRKRLASKARNKRAADQQPAPP